ncbi:hypothetical protein SEA_ATUIN_293 [Arthrobacter phage Atuin]|nr:hypothetical protein SEA_ATUIN_92 [Arthrobacter phage Atuin]
MDFVETMVEYLDGYRLDWDNRLTATLVRIEKKHPGFTERYNNFGEDVEGYRISGDDKLLIDLLHEGFIIDAIFEEDSIDQMREKLGLMEEKKRTWHDDWEDWNRDK